MAHKSSSQFTKRAVSRRFLNCKLKLHCASQVSIEPATFTLVLQKGVDDGKPVKLASTELMRPSFVVCSWQQTKNIRCSESVLI
jgi:hypothetical protein